MAEKGGTYIGRVSNDHPYAQPFADVSEAVHPRLFEGKSPEEYMKNRAPDEEGYFMPGSELLWINKKKDSEGPEVPMSSNPLDPTEA